LLVDADSYFLELLRYIHLNPVRARIVDSPEQYRWSSHRVYLGKMLQPWVHTDFELRLFAREEDRARVLYKTFIEERIGADIQLPHAHPRERRVLGDDRFVDTLLGPAMKRYPMTTLDRITEHLCRDLNVTIDQLRSASQHRRLSKARGMIAARAIDERVATLSELARFFNRSDSALSRSIERYARARQR
jgi:hypothetical protein